MVNDIPLNFSYSTQKAAKHFFPIKNSSTPTHTTKKQHIIAGKEHSNERF